MWLLAASVVGGLTGLVVVGFQVLVLDLLWTRVEQHPLLSDLTPAAGLALAAIVLRLGKIPSPDTTESYIRTFHSRRSRLELRHLPARLVAGVLTIGLGGSLGLEGPSILMGGTLGDTAQRALARLFDRDEAKTMLVAGGAAGIAAVFKAPLTGLVFAMEVPFADDLARHVLGPALVASASGYLVEVSLRGVAPLVPVVGHPAFGMRELALSLLLGLGTGLGARLVVRSYRLAKHLFHRLSAPVRIGIAGSLLAALGLLNHVLFGPPLALGPGDDAIRAAALGHLSWTLLLVLFATKALATSATAGADGVGGIFFPLVVMGIALGGAFGEVVGRGTSLFPLVGMASLLGAAYHTPLAGVSFAAEATGRAAFVLPTFVATAAAYAVVGSDSISGAQRRRRPGTDAILDASVASVMVPPVALRDHEPLEAVIDRVLRHRRRTFAVVDAGGRLEGVVDVEDVMALEPAQRSQSRVRDVMRTDHPRARISDPLPSAAATMAASDTDYLPVVDEQERLVGVVLTSEILRLRDLVAGLEDEERP